ncbi:ABC transporter ATP-binding protein [Antarctobacter jejuensis]|uniref:ABC transporter ATP-binding protein n=1 Tax=Antarctobacter jejuensis TaxID=1439938 RepID=UPI003FD183D8
MSWALLDARERRNAWIVLAIILISAFSAMLMVASIMPFLAVMSDPDRIQTSRALSWAFEKGGFESDYDFLVALGIGSIAVIILSNLFQILKVFAISRFSSMRAFSISTRLLENYSKQPYLYAVDRHSADLSKQILDEAQQVVERGFRPILDGIASIVTAALIVLLLFYLEPKVTALVFLALGAVYGSTIFITRRWTTRLGKIRAEANSQRYKIANEALAGIKDIKLLGRERFYLDKFSNPARRMARSVAQISVAAQSPQYIIHAAMFTGMIVLCLLLMVSSGASGQDALQKILPTIGLMALAGQRLLPEISRLFQSVTLLSFSGPAVQSVYDDLVSDRVHVELPHNRCEPLGLKSSLTFEKVSFRFPNAKTAGLSEVDFVISAGERIGIVGSTGAGKSTLANLILGLIPPSDGRILIDGQPLAEDNRRAWQHTIGYVPQEIFLADASVRENIALGVRADQIDEAQLIDAAKTAQVHEFITQQLDNGYDTNVGERGSRLSGGQRQRIGIARALYNQADLVLFDEATSALDNATEKEVMRSIEALPGDKTLIMIAHRLSTLAGCDRIMVLRQGKIAGFDTWAALERDCAEFRAIAHGVHSTGEMA